MKEYSILNYDKCHVYGYKKLKEISFASVALGVQT